MRLNKLELSGFKSFAKKTEFVLSSPITAIVGPNGSGKSNVAESLRWVLGEQSLKSLRGRKGEDLIFNGAGSSARSNRAMVAIEFDNQDRSLPIDFSTVTLSRVVHRDGVNEYAINGTTVKMRDVVELLSHASIGSSGHHIISQGQADRILNSSPKDRKAMIEESLGLKIYHWKLENSEKKLIKTAENIKQVESLRREVAPHLRFLTKQVEKIAQADELRRELKKSYLEYLSREDFYLKTTREEIKQKMIAPRGELEQVLNQLNSIAQPAQANQVFETHRQRIREIDDEIRQFNSDKEELSRKIGRLEGRLESAPQATTEEKIIRKEEVEKLLGEIKEIIERSGAQDYQIVRMALDNIYQLINRFWTNDSEVVPAPREWEIWQQEKATLQNSEIKITEQIEALSIQKNKLTEELEILSTQERQSERKWYELKAKQGQLESDLREFNRQESNLNHLADDFKREVDEAIVLIDHEMSNWSALCPPEADWAGEPRDNQEMRRRTIEKNKIKLEELGGGKEAVLEEYKETKERDEYLAKELMDLKIAEDSLRQIMTELRTTLTKEFALGLKKINQAFNHYFTLMFDGGSAALNLLVQKKKISQLDLVEEMTEEMIDELEPGEEGLDIVVNVPRKKIKGLDMLSGGERALTSIALLFAMSQVNPPPFLVLDETDAALDEANSRKYGNIVESLAEKSQLILITHNRETMSRAGILYGVTMGSDGISRLLSVKFDEATNYAK